MKGIIFSLLIIHSLVHLLGFTKAYSLFNFPQLTKFIPKTYGIFWLCCSLLFLLTLLLILINNEYWWVISSVSILLSQYLIINNWQDAKSGTLVNLLLIALTLIGIARWDFYHSYKKEVYQNLSSTPSIDTLTEKDIINLPEPVKKYLRYSGAIGKPKVYNFKVEFDGKIRKNTNSEWMPFHSEQYNFLEASERLFFMKATMKHLPVDGFHNFKNGKAYMDIRLLSLVKVQYQSGHEMGIAETVTFFNDMCCMAPATLIDPRIQWLETYDNKVRAAFINNNIRINAWLYFNHQGELINFISEDRYATLEDGTLKKLRWSTPLKEYKEFKGRKVAGYAETIYTYPEGDFTYGTFSVREVKYNCLK